LQAGKVEILPSLRTCITAISHRQIMYVSDTGRAKSKTLTLFASHENAISEHLLDNLLASSLAFRQAGSISSRGSCAKPTALAQTD